MQLQFHFEAAMERAYPDDYVREAMVEVLDYGGDEGFDGPFVVGRLKFHQVLWADAENDGQDLWDICDCHSADLEGIFAQLMDDKGEVRPEFETDELTCFVVVLDRLVLHPDAVPHAQHILAAAMALFGEFTLVVTWRNVVPLVDKQLAHLGFRKAAETNLIFRHSSLLTEYGKAHPLGKDESITATEGHEAWVEAEWGNSKKVEP